MSGTQCNEGSWKFMGKTNENEEWAVEPCTPLMDHVPSPEVVGLAFYRPGCCRSVITCREEIVVERGPGREPGVSKD